MNCDFSLINTSGFATTHVVVFLNKFIFTVISTFTCLTKR